MKWILCDINATWPTVFCAQRKIHLLRFLFIFVQEKSLEIKIKKLKWDKNYQNEENENKNLQHT